MKKYGIYGLMFFVLLVSAFASNTATFHFYDADGNDITNVEVIGFECTDDTCTSITGSAVDTVDSGSTNDAALTIPAVTSDTRFIFYMFAEESDSYLPHYEMIDVSGDGATGDFDVTLERKDVCTSVIQSFSATNSVAPGEPIYVDVEVDLEADTYSAFEYTDEVYTYGVTEYEDWFTAETEVVLEIVNDDTGAVVDLQSETLYILAEDSENVAFEWTPTLTGTYTATVTTTVTDEQCEASNPQEAIEVIEVVEEEDTEYCYTLIQNIEVEEIEDGSVTTLQVGDTYTVTFEKISNSVDEDGNLDPLATDITVEIYDPDGNLDYSLSDTMAANADATTYEEYTFAWVPATEGTNTVVVTGEAVGCPYTDNIEGEASNTFPVEGATALQPPVAIADFLGLGYWSYTDYDITFDGSRSYDPDGTIVSYEWDMDGDGAFDDATGATPTYTFPAEGTYTVTLLVTDNDGLTDTDTASVRINILFDFDFDFGPLVSCDGPYSATLGDSISFNGYAFDIDGSIVSYSWDFGDGSISSLEDPVYTYGATGTYTVTLYATDDDGNTNSCTTTATITEANVEPTIDCSAIPTTGTTNEPVEMEVTSVDSDDDIVSYEWDFGDGSTDSTSTDLGSDTKTHTYTSAGTYTVEVTVTDDDGATATCTADIEISDENAEPTIDCSLFPTSGTVGELLTFEITASDSDGTIVQYDWDFDDGTTATSTTSNSATHTYSAAGSYDVVGTVTDDDGATASCPATTVVIAEADALTVQIIASTTSGIAPLLVDFTAIVTGGTEPYTYAWDLDGDGVVDSTDPAPSSTYTTEGVYIVTLVVTDADGDVASDTETITVGEDLPAIAVASADPTSGEAPLWVHFSSAGSSGNEPLSYSWSFGDGSGTSSDPNPGHYYDEEGTYIATLTVTDADGDTDSDTVTITVGDELENIASDHYYVEGIAISNDGKVDAGDDLEIWISAENIAGIDKGDVSFNVIIQELGIYETTEEFDLNVDEAETKVLSIHIPADADPGMYYMRITISDDDVKRVIYRDIIVE